MSAAAVTVAIMTAALLLLPTRMAAFITRVDAGTAQQTPEPVARLMQSLGFTTDEIRRLAAGRAVARTLPSEDGREVAAAGVIRIDLAPGEFARRLADITRFKKSEAVLQIGTFSPHPTLNDVSELTLDQDDLRSLRHCRVGDCDVQLPRSIIERLQAEVNWRSPGAAQHATEIFRTGLVQFVQQYRASGRPHGMVYVDKAEPVDPALEFQHLANSDTHVLARFADLKRYLLDPTIRSSEISDVIYWSKEKVARKAVVSVTHLAILTQPSGSSVAYVAGSKQLYGSHYFESSLGVTIVVPHVSPTSSYVAYVNRSRVDAFDGLLGGITRRTVRSRARGALAEMLEGLQQRLRRGDRAP